MPKPKKKSPPNLGSLLEKVKESMGEDFYNGLSQSIEDEKATSYGEGRRDYRDQTMGTGL